MGIEKQETGKLKAENIGKEDRKGEMATQE